LFDCRVFTLYVGCAASASGGVTIDSFSAKAYDVSAVNTETTIKHVEITGMPPVIVGTQIPTDKSMISLPGDAKYTVNAVGWFDNTAEEWVDSRNKFEAGHSYNFSVELNPKEGYSFDQPANLTATINGKPAEILKNGNRVMVRLLVGEPQICTVTFLPGGGTGEMAPVQTGGSYILPECGFTAPEGKTFDKWTVEGLGDKAPGSAINVISDIKVTAVWKDKVIVYTIQFKPGEGSGAMQAVEREANATYKLPECTFTPKDEYSSFKCWQADETNATYAAGFELTVIRNFVFTAVWEHKCKLTLVEAKSADCATETVGKKAYYTCKGCGKNYEDEAGAKEIASIENWGVIDFQHDFSGDMVFVNATVHAFKCVNDGCEKSGNNAAHEKDKTEFTAEGHEEYCKCGYKMTVKDHEHELKADDGKHWYECACGDKTGEAEHYGGTATCTQKAVCEACENEYGDTAPHAYGEATCTKKATCSVCGAETGELAAHTDADGNNKCDVCDADLTPAGDGNGGNGGAEGDGNGGNGGGGDKTEEPSGLSGGAIAGIVIGGVVVLGVGGFALIWFVIKKKSFADLIAIFKK